MGAPRFSIDDMRLDDEPAGEAVGGATKAGKAPKRREPFIIITATQASRLEGATYLAAQKVFIRLLFRSFGARGKPFELPNGDLSGADLDRFAKSRALDQLEELGLISVRVRPGKLSVITIIGGGK